MQRVGFVDWIVISWLVIIDNSTIDWKLLIDLSDWLNIMFCLPLRIGIMSLVRKKVQEFEAINGTHSMPNAVIEEVSFNTVANVWMLKKKSFF